MHTGKKFFGGLLFCLGLALAASIAAVPDGTAQAEAAAPKLNKKKASVNEGKTITLSVKKATGKVTWKSSNSKVVKIVSTSGKNKSKVKLKGIKKGVATITAKVKGKKVKGKKVKTKKLTATLTVKHVHKWRGYATCTQPDVCMGCGATRGKAAGHTWDADHICTACKILDMPNLIQFSPVFLDGSNFLFGIDVTNVGGETYRLYSKTGYIPAELKTAGKKYTCYMCDIDDNGEYTWWSEYTNSSNDLFIFSLTSFDNPDTYFAIDYSTATITFDISYFNQRTSLFDKYRVTLNSGGKAVFQKL